jgi:uncharacterized Ntn-hydrolase superfamily protein
MLRVSVVARREGTSARRVDDVSNAVRSLRRARLASVLLRGVRAGTPVVGERTGVQSTATKRESAADALGS